MNPKSTTSSGGESPRGSKNNVGRGSHRGGDRSDGEDPDESGMSEEDDEETPVRHSSSSRGTRRTRGRGHNRSKQNEDAEDGDEDTSEDDEDGRNDDDDEDDEDEEEEGDDSSDMDVQECEKKRFEYIDDLSDLEKQFTILREQLYRERISQIERKLTDVRSGTASDFMVPVQELETQRNRRLDVAAVLRDLRLKNIQCKFDAEELACQQNFISEKGLLEDSLRADLEEKIHMLEEDKHNVDFSSGLWEQSSSKRKRKADALDPDRRKKPVTVTGPYIVYMLHESEIMDDWTMIKKSLSQRKKT